LGSTITDPETTVRRLATGLVLLAAAAGSALDASPALAQDEHADRTVDVFQVSGLIDDVVADEIGRAIERAEDDGAQALILQVNTPGAVISDREVAELANAVHDADVPVAVWVGPSGARALGAGGQLLGAAAVTGMAPGTRAGDFGAPLPVDFPLELGRDADRLRTSTVGADDALASGLVRIPNDDQGVPVLRNMVFALDGLEYDGRVVETVEEQVAEDGVVTRELTAEPRFFKLGLVNQLLHTVASPPVAYLLLTIGLALLIFEFFTAGVGVAGVVGALCTVLGCYGFAALPTRPLAIALLLIAFFGFAVDVQTGVPRVWTAIGLAAFTIASFILYTNGLALSWITLLAGIGGVALAFVVGMPSMVRARFATPTIGREWMIGELGDAVEAVDPDGVVRVRDATWRARTNRATPIPAGGRIRVVAIEGVTLEVEPEDGAARDYRDRAGQRNTPGAEPA
jgi:membrane-bound serine protease (ClpP class)